jgi:catechol 2,3-dioxygenase-like lactoylglutathione lyase family enzyme
MGKIDWAGESTAALEVSDYDRSLAWYRDMLGWQVVLELAEWKWAQLQSPVKGLLVGIGQSEQVKEGGGATLTFTVKDIDAVAAQIKAKGVTFTREPTTIRPGVRICFIRGPEGISIELLERDKKYT